MIQRSLLALGFAFSFLCPSSQASAGPEVEVLLDPHTLATHRNTTLSISPTNHSYPTHRVDVL